MMIMTTIKTPFAPLFALISSRNIAPYAASPPAAAVSPDTKQFRKVQDSCRAIAGHIRAATPDRAETLNMSAYFKVGEHGLLYFLFCGAIGVALRFRDAAAFVSRIQNLDQNFNKP
jgi:hypothetical protein